MYPKPPILGNIKVKKIPHIPMSMEEDDEADIVVKKEFAEDDQSSSTV